MDEGYPVNVAFPIPDGNLYTYLSPQPLLRGTRVEAPLKNRRLTGVVVTENAVPPENVQLKTILRVLDNEPLTGPWSFELAQWIAQNNLCSLGEAINALLPSAIKEKETPFLKDEISFQSTITLSDEQTKAIETILNSEQQWYYLRGQTGSGKTEVYFRTAQEIIARGQGVIYLVPEISLTHQLIDEAVKRFGQVAVLHSGLTPSQRLKEWLRLKRGEVPMVLGARSAIFAPMANIGLIIVDEEPELSYKSQSVPRFHARSVAMILSKWTKAKLVMGSATPSLEALEAIQRGLFVELKLGKRLAGGSPPKVHLVDTRTEKNIISAPLAEAILKTHSEGFQSIILLNRRGYTNLFHCLNCHYEMHCPRCSVPMTYHKMQKLMRCHHCGYETRPPSACPNCGSHEVGWAGYGTELVEQEMIRLFPQLRMQRFDTDTIKGRAQADKVLKMFYRGELDLLLGTQMIAKGLNFPKLKTVGILNADIGLSLPDFRAAERVYSLIRQTTGRAGRYLPNGEVYIQTYRPDFWVMRYASEGQDDEFYKQELELRRQLLLPPFRRLLRVVVRHQQQTKAKKDMDHVVDVIRTQNFPIGDLIGPATCPIEKLADWYRYHLLLRSKTTDILKTLGHKLMGLKLPQRSMIELDMDPYHLR